MPFAGNMGAAAAMTPIAVLSAPGGALTYDTDAITLLKTDIGTVTPILRPQLANLRWSMTVDQAPILLPLVVGAPDIVNADTGGLVSAAPAANQHGIPANFGPGRGNWTQDDVERLRILVSVQVGTSGAVTDVGAVRAASLSLAGGNISIAIRNYSPLEIDGLLVDLEWRHSLTVA